MLILCNSNDTPINKVMLLKERKNQTRRYTCWRWAFTFQITDFRKEGKRDIIKKLQYTRFSQLIYWITHNFILSHTFKKEKSNSSSQSTLIEWLYNSWIFISHSVFQNKSQVETKEKKIFLIQKSFCSL